MKTKRIVMLLAVLALAVAIGVFVLPNVFSQGKKNDDALAAGYIITETEGVLNGPVREPWIAFRKNMSSDTWRFLGSSEKGELTPEALAGMKTVILCDGSVGTWASYSGIGSSGTKKSEEIEMTFIDAETHCRIGVPFLLSAQKLPERTGSLSALTYSDYDVLAAIQAQTDSGIAPGYPALGLQDERKDLIAGVPRNAQEPSAEDMKAVTILILPEEVKSLPDGVAEKVWFVVVAPGSAAAAWAEEKGIPYLESGSEILTVPENTPPERLACPGDLFLERDDYQQIFADLGLTAIGLPDGMSPPDTVLTDAFLPFLVRPGTAAERAVLRANDGSMNAGYYLPPVMSGEGVLPVREGSVVYFGSWNQDGDPENGNEPIPWNVITVHGDQALLLSSRVLDLRLFGEPGQKWADSGLRAWLNGEFLETAFTEAEQEALLNAGTHKNGNKIVPRADGEDRVFVPGEDDYSPSRRLYTMTERAPATPYVLSFGVPKYYRTPDNIYSLAGSDMQKIGCYAWWTRTGKASKGASGEGGARGVRPMIWISLADPVLIAENTPPQAETPAESREERLAAAAGSLKAGDTVILGEWDQDGFPSTKEEIEWTVLEVKNGKALLLSRSCLAAREQNEQQIYSSWDSSELHIWLNADFYNGAFSATERAAIVLTDISNSNQEGKPEWYSSETGGTRDRVFLLSWKDVTERYFAAPETRTARATRRAMYDNIAIAGGNSPWWLRSKGEGPYKFAVVSETGGLVSVTEAETSVGVRPALWIDLSAFGTKTD